MGGDGSVETQRALQSTIGHGGISRVTGRGGTTATVVANILIGLTIGHSGVGRRNVGKQHVVYTFIIIIAAIDTQSGA